VRLKRQSQSLERFTKKNIQEVLGVPAVLVQRKSLLEDSRGSATVVVGKEVVEFVDRSRFTKVFKSLSFFLSP
jgi:hypothetical protein